MIGNDIKALKKRSTFCTVRRENGSSAERPFGAGQNGR